MINFFIKNECSIPRVSFLKNIAPTMELFSKYESIRQYQINDTEGKINFLEAEINSALTIYWGTAKEIRTARKRNNSF